MSGHVAAFGRFAEGHRRHVALAAIAVGLVLAAAGPSLAVPVAGAAAAVLALARAPRAAVTTAVLVAVAAAGGGQRIAAIDAPGARLAPGRPLEARAHLLTVPRPGPFGASVEARALGGPARGARLVLRVNRGLAPPRGAGPGTEVRVAGFVRPAARGAGFDVEAYHRRRGIAAELQVHALRATGSRRGGVAGVVDRIGRRAQAGIAHGLPPPERALALGMVLGQDERITEPVRDEFRASGLAHVLAVSGQNVMLLAAVALPLLALTGLGHRGRLAATVALVALYVPLAGAGPSLQRAGVMGAASLVAVAAARPASRAYVLLLAACVTLALNPRACADPGWQLSFAAVAGILGLVPLLRRTLGPLPRVLAEGVAVTVAATVATAPLMAHHFGSVSPAGLPANVLALPLVAPIMWLGMVRGALAQMGPVAQPLVDLAGVPLGPLLGGLSALAAAFAEMPGGQMGLTLRTPAGVGAAYAALAVVAAASARAAGRIDPAPATARWRRARPRHRIAAVVTAGIAVALVLAWLVLPPRPPGRFTVSFLDVGQGDATLVQAPGNVAILFDGGPPEAAVTRLLRRAGVGELALVVATHQSRDHHGGLQPVVERHRVRALLQNGDGTRDPTFRRVVATARARGARVMVPVQGQTLAVGPVRIRVLGPPPRPPGPAPEDPNPRALAAVVSYGGFDLFLSGDAESDALGDYGLPDVEAMKVSHHGSADPGLPAVLERLTPALAAIEVGADNTYGHPVPATVRALRAAGARVYRTDRDGTVRLGVPEDGAMDVESDR
ncbi:MAG TPA: ComEC/Rec2 family competence protein [Thermoleophilaceae bacterium]|nr:ComEC/Rec2 family competence protein [Thermoleophilaceae bacterium]